MDADFSLVCFVNETSANVNNVRFGYGLLEGEKALVLADAGCQAAEKRPESKCMQSYIALRAAKLRALDRQ